LRSEEARTLPGGYDVGRKSGLLQAVPRGCTRPHVLVGEPNRDGDGLRVGRTQANEVTDVRSLRHDGYGFR
jgi:hypothetical protein